MPYINTYDYRTETAFISYVEGEKEPVKCKLCLDVLSEDEDQELCVCDWCKSNTNP